MIRALLAAALLLVAPYGFAKCAPKYVLRIVTVADYPGGDAFSKMPKTLYRSGEGLGRLEEEKNPATGAHMLVVINEPDIWVVNRADMTGQHMVDPGPELVFHALILNGAGSPHWNNFEFGCEVPFMNAVGAKGERGEDGRTTYVHVHEGITAKLIVGKNGLPQRLELSGPENNFSLDYAAYEELRDAPKDLFAKPARVTFTEPAPQ